MVVVVNTDTISGSLRLRRGLDPQRGLSWRARHVGAGFLAHDDLGVPPHGALDVHFGCAPDNVAYHGAAVETLLDVVVVERRRPHG